MGLILGVKNIFKLEGIMNSRTCSVNFLNGSLPIFPLAHHKIKPNKMACVKVRMPFVEKALWYCYSEAYVQISHRQHACVN